MNTDEVNEKLERSRKFKEYEMKIVKMAGYLTDYYLDRAIESDDFSQISSFLIDYFSGMVGKDFDLGYLVSKYNEYGLNEKAEDIDFDMNEWYKLLYERNIFAPDPEFEKTRDMTEDEYVKYLIEKRKKTIEEE